jgi:hypothetical protein
MTLTRLGVGAAAVFLPLLAGQFLLAGRTGIARVAAAAAAEAVLLTLLASLWFASLGAGEWWLVFLLVGLLVATAERNVAAAPLRSGAWRSGLEVAATSLRYLAAGALLAWLIG